MTDSIDAALLMLWPPALRPTVWERTSSGTAPHVYVPSVYLT